MARTDPEIARDAVEAMRLDLRIPDDRIKAGTRDGLITLEGNADWNYHREAAESCFRKLNGVRGVTNKIEVKQKVSTIEVKTKIEDALRRSAEVDSRRITVSPPGRSRDSLRERTSVRGSKRKKRRARRGQPRGFPASLTTSPSFQSPFRNGK